REGGSSALDSFSGATKSSLLLPQGSHSRQKAVASECGSHHHALPLGGAGPKLDKLGKLPPPSVIGPRVRLTPLPHGRSPASSEPTSPELSSFSPASAFSSASAVSLPALPLASGGGGLNSISSSRGGGGHKDPKVGDGSGSGQIEGGGPAATGVASSG
ncbi:unnamed protein product, partial [Discosporangium mesarthrocarpum]